MARAARARAQKEEDDCAELLANQGNGLREGVSRPRAFVWETRRSGEGKSLGFSEEREREGKSRVVGFVVVVEEVVVAVWAR
jgi:hypothetical protein